jgi:L-malate glycosyltransferase
MVSAPPIKKVVVIPSWYPSPPQSPFQGLFLREQAQCLARRFDVTVLTPHFPSLADQVRLNWGPELIKENDQGLKTWRVRQLKLPTLRRWIPFFANPDHVLVYYRKFAAAIRRGFSRYVTEEGLPDVVHAHVVFPAGWIAVELGRRYCVPVVLTEHSGPFAMHLTTPKQRSLVRDILLWADRLVAVSPALGKAMEDFLPEARIEVVGNLIDTGFFTPTPRHDTAARKLRFFYLGLLVEGKGVRFLLQAIRELVTRGFKDFEVVLGGDGPQRAMLETLVADLKISEHCRFLGMLERTEVREQMQACDVFVLPSLGETFGIVVGEAMACGKPVLSTRCGGPEFLVTPETGILTAPGDSGALADAMASYLDRRCSFQPERIRASVVERFGEVAFLEKHETIYQEAIRNHQASQIKKAG